MQHYVFSFHYIYLFIWKRHSIAAVVSLEEFSRDFTREWRRFNCNPLFDGTKHNFIKHIVPSFWCNILLFLLFSLVSNNVYIFCRFSLRIMVVFRSIYIWTSLYLYLLCLNVYVKLKNVIKYNDAAILKSQEECLLQNLFKTTQKWI